MFGRFERLSLLLACLACWITSSGCSSEPGSGCVAGQSAGSSVVTAIAGLTGVAEISGGWVHTCARMNDGTVRCWGSNNQGESAPNGFLVAF